MAIALSLVIIGIAANLFLTIRLEHQVEKLGEAKARPSLPCAAVPTRFVMEEPVCAQKLIEAMNVTNFRVLANAPQVYHELSRYSHTPTCHPNG